LEPWFRERTSAGRKKAAPLAHPQPRHPKETLLEDDSVWGGMMIQGLAAFFFGTKEEYGSWISFFPEKNSHVLHNIPYLRPLTSRLS